MVRLPKKAKDCLKIFIEIGGLSAVVAFVICGQYVEAIISLIVFLVIAVIMEKYFP